MAGNDAPSSGGLVGPIPTTVSLASCPALEAKSILPPVRVFRSTSVENLNSTPKDRAYWRAKSLRRLFSMREPEEDLEGSARLPIVEESIECLRRNDYGGYTIPAHNLYPFQWNWDSAIVAAGWAVFDEARAWEEFEKLFSGQWEDGMVPSIIFHRPSTSYFPGPEIWGSPAAPSESTGITQPPVASVSARFLFEHTEHAELAEEQMADLFPKLLASHRWWYKARDPEKKGIVAILHPWESGMDNSPAWDAALQFPVDNLPPYERKDLQHVNACMRPTKETYDHYLTLLYRFKAENYYDSNKLYWVSPFRMTDLCTNSILFRANRDLRWLAIKLGKTDVVAEIDEWLERGFEGFKQLWDEDAGLFKCQDQLTGKLDDAATSAAFLPLFAGVASKEQAAKLAENLKQWLDKVPFGVPSTDPRDPRFEPLRYWRGPVWIIINWMIFNGLRHYGYDDLAQRIYDDSVALTSNAGLREYFDPQTGDGAGGELFSWTAAMCLAWLDRPSAIAIGHKMSGPKIHLDQEVSPPKLLIWIDAFESTAKAKAERKSQVRNFWLLPSEGLLHTNGEIWDTHHPRRSQGGQDLNANYLRARLTVHLSHVGALVRQFTRNCRILRNAISRDQPPKIDAINAYVLKNFRTGDKLFMSLLRCYIDDKVEASCVIPAAQPRLAAPVTIVQMPPVPMTNTEVLGSKSRV